MYLGATARFSSNLLMTVKELFVVTTSWIQSIWAPQNIMHQNYMIQKIAPAQKRK